MLGWWGQPRRRIKIPKWFKEDLYEQQNGACMYCGIKMDIAYFEADHKTPFSRGSRDTPGNFRLLCGPCNKCKSNLTNSEFRNLYELTPARMAKGPPTRIIPRKHFGRITNELKKEAARERRAMRREEEEAFFDLLGP